MTIASFISTKCFYCDAENAIYHLAPVFTVASENWDGGSFQFRICHDCKDKYDSKTTFLDTQQFVKDYIKRIDENE